MGTFDRIVLTVVTLGLFGPYVSGGVRTEQAFIYGAAAALFVLMPWRWVLRPLEPVLLGLVVGWCGFAAVAAVGGLFAPASAPAPAAGGVLAGMDNLLLPVAVLAVVLMTVTNTTRGEALKLVATILAVGAALNGLLALVMSQVDLAEMLRPWWSGSDSPGSLTTAENAATMGRYSGIVNQPAEAGLLYGIGGLCAIYLWFHRPWRLFALMALITVGGALSVSKVFLLVALPLLGWQLVRYARGKWTVGLLVTAGAVGVTQAGWLTWTGSDYLLRLLRPTDGDWVRFYTAGRFGQSSSLTPVVDVVSSVSPVFGVGASGVGMPYDNAWVEAYVMAGAIGVAGYTLALVLVACIASRCEPGAERSLAWCLTLLAVGASFGLPALTANRAGAALWLLIGVLSVSRSGLGRQDDRVARGEPDAELGLARPVVPDEQPHTVRGGHGRGRDLGQVDVAGADLNLRVDRRGRARPDRVEVGGVDVLPDRHR